MEWMAVSGSTVPTAPGFPASGRGRLLPVSHPPRYRAGLSTGLTVRAVQDMAGEGQTRGTRILSGLS
ncbi:MAG TPA: hypothetical protein VN541_12795, partial [Tepidisphaeraceae bacterium]|nr:hypothetical protein [Tepidisphaeraceae bacterium]